MTIHIPSNAIVILIGPAGAGKSTFARRHFPDDAIVSPDSHRAEIAGNEASQSCNDEVFERVQRLVEDRASSGLLTVVDATNTRGPGRTELGWHALRHHRPLVAIALVLPIETCLSRNAGRQPSVPGSVIRRQAADLEHLATDLEAEGYAAVHIFRSAAELDAVRVVIRNEMG